VDKAAKKKSFVDKIRPYVEFENDPMSGIKGAVGALGAGAANASTLPLVVMENLGSPEKRAVYHQLMKKIKAAGIETNKKGGHGIRDQFGQHYNPATNFINRANSAPGLAHEFGHSQNKIPFLSTLGPRYVSKISQGALLPYVLKVKSPVAAKRAAILAAALSAPLVLDEAIASGIGAKAMGPTASLLTKARAFAGVPSYATMATAPLMAYAIKKKLGGYKDSEETKKENIKMKKTALEQAIEWRMQKLATYVPQVSDIEDEMGSYLSPKEAPKVQQNLNTEAEKHFSLRHPYLTGIPTFGAWPISVHDKLKDKVMRELLRSNPRYQKAMTEKSRHEQQMKLEHAKAEAPANAVRAAALPAAALFAEYMANKQMNRNQDIEREDEAKEKEQKPVDTWASRNI
jgi:hypothetical protein